MTLYHVANLAELAASALRNLAAHRHDGSPQSRFERAWLRLDATQALFRLAECAPPVQAAKALNEVRIIMQLVSAEPAALREFAAAWDAWALLVDP